MKKILMGIFAMLFATGIAATAYAGSDKAHDEAVAKACKDKKPGEEVTVDGKKVKCPAKK
jgi:uncharacterized protein YxeA